MKTYAALACLSLANVSVRAFAPDSVSIASSVVRKFPAVSSLATKDLSSTHSKSALNLAVDPDSINSLVASSSITTSILSNEEIKTAFNVATFGPQILWLFMILLPKNEITKKIMGSYAPIIAFSLVHLFIVIVSASQENGTAPLVEFNDVFDPSGDPQQAMMGMMKYPNFVSEEWSHVLTWDLFVGRIVWLDGLKRGIFTAHSVLFCNLIGPPGFLMHVATCLLTGKGLPGNEAEDLPAED
jgi:hypothetical protein